jgi:hypothetical protein
VKIGQLTIFWVCQGNIITAMEAKEDKEQPLKNRTPKLYHWFLSLLNNVLAYQLLQDLAWDRQSYLTKG